MIDIVSSVLNLAIVMATPIALASVGEVYSERSGVLNLGIEGIMLLSAFTSFHVTYITRNIVWGYISALLVGAVLGLLVAFLTVTLGVDQVITGMGIYFLGFGLSDFLYRAIYGTTYVTVSKSTQIPIPLLSSIPVLGKGLFEQYPEVYLSYVLIPLLWFILYKSRWGLSIRAVGENPKAADTLGVNVFLTRYIAVIFGSILAGLSGGILCLAITGLFYENLTFGMGFIAVGLVTFGKWDPINTWLGSFIFGFTWSVATTLQEYFAKMGYPSATYFLLMLPYLVIVTLLIVFARNARPPAALTKPYRRES